MSIKNTPNLRAIESAGNTPPVSPVTGGLYIILDTPTGAWASNANKIALYNGTTYEFFTPTVEILLWAKANNTLYLFDTTSGSWEIANANASSGSILPISDATALIKNNSDNSKQFILSAAAISTSTLRTFTLPDNNTTVVGTDVTQTLTNKTINGSNNTISNITESAITLSDNTTNNVDTTKHGFAPKGDGDTSKFLNANGAYSVPSGTSLTVREEDGSPNVASVTEIRVTNGTLTNNGSGSVSINISGGGGGAPTDARYVVTQANGSLSDEIVIPSFASHADILPSSPHSKDDEFNAGSLDGKWSWLNQGSSTATFGVSGWITINPQASNWRCLVQTVPSGNWTVTAKLSAGFGFVNDGYAGIVLFGGTDGTGDVWCLGKDGGTSIVTRGEQVSGYGFSGTRSNTNVTWGVNTAYLRMEWDGTNIRYWISHDGIQYNRFTSFVPSYTPTKFGIATRSSDTQPSSFDHFRVM